MRKIFLAVILLFILSISPVYAVGIDMDLDNSVNTSTVVDLSGTSENVTNTTNSSIAKVSTTQTSEDFTLSVSDIINIILISVGIVLIFLAIAILIKIR